MLPKLLCLLFYMLCSCSCFCFAQDAVSASGISSDESAMQHVPPRKNHESKKARAKGHEKSDDVVTHDAYPNSKKARAKGHEKSDDVVTHDSYPNVKKRAEAVKVIRDGDAKEVPIKDTGVTVKDIAPRNAGSVNAAKMVNDEYTVTLKNGLQIIVIPDHSSPIVAHGVFYRVGSFDDPIGRAGMAHLLEHLMFGVTTTYSNNDYVKYVSRLGGRMNAFTWVDRTFYYSILPSAQGLDSVMGFEADRMCNVLYSDEKALHAEKEVVLGELTMREDLMSRVFNALVLELNYDYQFKRPVIGFVDEIKKISPSDLESFYSKYYAPNNAVLLVVGDVDPAMVVKRAEAHFGDIPGVPDVKGDKFYSVAKLPRCDCRAKILEVVDSNEKQSSVSFALSMASSFAEYKSYPLMNGVTKMLAYVLGSQGGGRLNKILMEKTKRASSISVDTGGPYIFINVVPADGVTLDELAADVSGILWEIHKNGFTSEEIKEISSFAKTAAASGSDGIVNKFMMRASSMRSGASWKEVYEMIKSGAVNKKNSSEFIRAIVFENNDLVYAKVIGGKSHE